ncbi:TorF family putative porin [Thalassotalea sp. ND16A]|uniref:TorF family putative porin n=1 Tax=Thalassotalea sp. ND16A TaxID=1535422 RepID=UPI00051A223E|nr:TorF family putative porin [Thalassotalea sp. ND16A]KGJ94780.1 hypothetical protein ND16A_1404 [Thalassotalea sp. ND16A]
MNKALIALATSCLLVVGSANADVSSTVNLTSDYTFNGVSQTNNDPALQASLDYAGDSGIYLGTWASNVDFGPAEDTNIEWDFYVGNYWQLNEKVGLDAGVAYYTYHGDDASSDYAYGEAYAKFGYNSSIGDTELNFWYAWDYFGTDAGHYIMMAAHTFAISEGHDIRVSVDRSTSDDVNKWGWGNNFDDESYNHYRIEYMTSFSGFDFNLAAEDTSMDWDTADSRVVLSVSKTFSL